MTKDQFIEYIKQPSLLNESVLTELTHLMSSYPYFPVLRMLYLRNLKNTGSHLFDQELREQAVFIPNREILFKYLNDNEQDEPFRLLKLPDEPVGTHNG
ncbi:MAG TPA: hypothetical protein VJ909_03420, partial [Prolixibacteraceae bacterium]|nr:hypothetical protein [Prolixibacteraceae bacterium]